MFAQLHCRTSGLVIPVAAGCKVLREHVSAIVNGTRSKSAPSFSGGWLGWQGRAQPKLAKHRVVRTHAGATLFNSGACLSRKRRQRFVTVCAKGKGKKKKAKKVSDDVPQTARRITETGQLPLKTQLGYVNSWKAAEAPAAKPLVRSSFRRKSEPREEAFNADSPDDWCNLPPPAARPAARPVTYQATSKEEQGRKVLIVDGYNVIFSPEPNCPLVYEMIATPVLEDQRALLLEAVREFPAYRGLDGIIIAYDAYIDGPISSGFTRTKAQDGVEVVFYADGQADTWIVEEVKRLFEADCTVVGVATSDNDLRMNCGKVGAFTITSVNFITDLEQVKTEREQELRKQMRRSALQEQKMSATIAGKNPTDFDKLMEVRNRLRAKEDETKAAIEAIEREKRQLQEEEERRAQAAARLEAMDLELKDGVVVRRTAEDERLEDGTGDGAGGSGHEPGENGAGGGEDEKARKQRRGKQPRRKYEGHAGFEQLGQQVQKKMQELQNVVIDVEADDDDAAGAWLRGALAKQRQTRK